MGPEGWRPVPFWGAAAGAQGLATQHAQKLPSSHIPIQGQLSFLMRLPTAALLARGAAGAFTMRFKVNAAPLDLPPFDWSTRLSYGY